MIKAEDQTVKATDLRIGNYVTSKTWKGCHRIDAIELIENGFKVLVKGFWHEFIKGVFVDIEPIELNEEWLIKLGFEKYGIWFRLFPIHIRYDKVEGLWHIAIELHTVKTKIKYVHEAQNIFYALTDTELTTKP